MRRREPSIDFTTLSRSSLEWCPEQRDQLHSLWAAEGFALARPSLIDQLVEGPSSWIHVGIRCGPRASSLVAACAVVAYRDSGLQTVGVLERITVREDLRREGIGTGLLEYCHTWGSGAGFDMFVASSRRRPSIGMFAGAGWTPEEVTNLFLWPRAAMPTALPTVEDPVVPPTTRE